MNSPSSGLPGPGADGLPRDQVSNLRGLLVRPALKQG